MKTPIEGHIERTLRSMDHDEKIQVSSDFTENVLAQMFSESVKKRSVFSKYWFAAAASIVIAFNVVAIVSSVTRENKTSENVAEMGSGTDQEQMYFGGVNNPYQ